VKKLKCNQNDCNKRFKRRAHLNKHKLIYSLIKKYICDSNQCYKQFKTCSQMNLHKSCVHLKENKFKCNQCLQTFNRKHHLISHSRIHSVEKPFVCNYKECNKKFSDKSLIQHIETHLGIKRQMLL
jgi:uncharacterized Zn-finger protein